MSYYDDFEPINLLNRYINTAERLRELGQLYDNKFAVNDPTDFQKDCLKFHNHGYDIGDQIYAHYAELGAILEQF